MTPQEECELIRKRQANCEGHRKRETWIGTMIAGSMTKVVGSVCAHCGISRSEYEATALWMNPYLQGTHQWFLKGSAP